MAYFKVGHEILSKDLGKLLNELNTEVQRYTVHVILYMYMYMDLGMYMDMQTVSLYVQGGHSRSGACGNGHHKR